MYADACVKSVCLSYNRSSDIPFVSEDPVVSQEAANKLISRVVQRVQNSARCSLEEDE